MGCAFYLYLAINNGLIPRGQTLSLSHSLTLSLSHSLTLSLSHSLTLSLSHSLILSLSHSLTLSLSHSLTLSLSHSLTLSLSHSLTLSLSHSLTLSLSHSLTLSLSPRRAQFLHSAWKKHQDAVYWVDVDLVIRKGLTFYQTRSNAIILQGTLPACCIPKVMRLKTGEVLFEKVYMSIPTQDVST